MMPGHPYWWVSLWNDLLCLIRTHDKYSPDTGRYDCRWGQGCVLWAPINAHSMRAALYDAYKLYREPAILKWKWYETVTDFEVDDGWWHRKMMMCNDDLTDSNTSLECGTWIWLRKWSWVRSIVSMLYAHLYVQVLQKGHPDSGL